MKEIKIGKKGVMLPESWEEMTRDQYWTYMLLLSAVMAGERQTLEAEKTFFSFLIGWNGADWTRMTDADTADMLRALFLEHGKRWGMDRLPDTECINLMPVWRGHKGPEDWLGDMTWGTFCDCLDLLSMAAQEGEGQTADGLARMMYGLPAEETPDGVLRLHCLALMQSVVAAMSSGPIAINGRDVDLSIVFRSHHGSGDGTGLAGVTFEVAESGVFGAFREVKDTGMWDVLLYLYKCRKSKEKEKK